MIGDRYVFIIGAQRIVRVAPPSAIGGVMDAGTGPGDPEDGEGNGQGQGKQTPEQVAHEWQANVRMAVSVARANNAGQTPGYLERLVTQLKRPKISWRDMTAQFIDQSLTTDYSYRRPNRRYVHAGLILPGNVPDALHEMVFFVDCSGSISEEMFRSYASEVASSLDTGVCDHLYVVYADDGVRHVDEFLPGDLFTCKTLGHGGTHFDDSFEWLAKNAPPSERARVNPLEGHEIESEAETARRVAEARAFQRSLFDAGFAGISWPTEYGGKGLPTAYQRVFEE